MKEYVIHAKVKNNLLLSRILERHKTVNEFCREHGLSASQVGELINMKTPAVYSESSAHAGEWTTAAWRIASVLAVHPSELFTEEQRVADIKTNEAFIEMSRQQALQLADPEEQQEAKQLVANILSSAGLNGAERMVINLRFGLGGGERLRLDECGDRLGVSRERARQIESKAMQKMRRRMNALEDREPDGAQEVEHLEAGEEA